MKVLIFSILLACASVGSCVGLQVISGVAQAPPPDNPPIPGEIHAHNRKFWFGKRTLSKCNSGDPTCPEGNRTVFRDLPQKKPGQLRLDSSVPSYDEPQQAFVAADGSFSFLHGEETLPSDILTDQFKYPGFGVIAAVGKNGIDLKTYFCGSPDRGTFRVFFTNGTFEDCFPGHLFVNFAVGAYEYV